MIQNAEELYIKGRTNEAKKVLQSMIGLITGKENLGCEYCMVVAVDLIIIINVVTFIMNAVTFLFHE